MEMKGFVRSACIVALVMPVLAVAQKQYGCDEVNWGEEVVKAFPNASKGCHSVMMKNNQPYAKYVAEVQSVDRTTKEVTLNMLDTKDKAFSKVVIAPKEGAHVKIDGKDTPVSKLKKGDRVSFYIPHDRWGLYADPDSTPINIVKREDL
jgi:Cu/Ag efflux protein CusF